MDLSSEEWGAYIKKLDQSGDAGIMVGKRYFKRENLVFRQELRRQDEEAIERGERLDMHIT